MAIQMIFENSMGYEPIRLTAKPVTLGRSSKSDVQIKDGMCSGQHATLHLEKDGSVILTDLNSTNGTYVNETLVNGGMRLYADDVVRIGDTRLRIDKSMLSPKEAGLLRANNNKTSFTQIELPEANLDTIRKAKDARRRALNIPESTPETSPDSADNDEISVVFDNDLEHDAASEQKAFEEALEDKSSMAPKSTPIPLQHDDESMSGVDVVYEMEKSSGQTKMIKLDREALVAKKRKSPPAKRSGRGLKKEEGLIGKFKKIFGGDD